MKIVYIIMYCLEKSFNCTYIVKDEGYVFTLV